MLLYGCHVVDDIIIIALLPPAKSLEFTYSFSIATSIFINAAILFPYVASNPSLLLRRLSCFLPRSRGKRWKGEGGGVNKPSVEVRERRGGDRARLGSLLACSSLSPFAAALSCLTSKTFMVEEEEKRRFARFPHMYARKQ